MTKPTQLVISEQAREVADNEIAYTLNETIYGKGQRGQFVQLLLNSQREAIIRECAEIVKPYSCWPNCESPTCEIRHQLEQAILAKLQNK